MSGRQAAIDRLKQPKCHEPNDALTLGSIDHLLEQLPKVVQFGKHRYVVNQWQGEWLVYGADCPHKLGPLEGSEIDAQGRITCPWHGYHFNVVTGKSCEQGISGLPSPPIVSIINNELVLTSP